MEVDGALEVTPSGEMVYAFPKGARQRFARGDRRAPANLCVQLCKALIGAALLASVALLRPLLAGTQMEVVSVRQEARLLAAAFRQSRAVAPPPTSEAPVAAAETAVEPLLGASNSSLALAAFAFLFGDDYDGAAAEDEQSQWVGVARAIRESKGAVCAEQLAPHMLEAVPSSSSALPQGQQPVQRVEDWVLPVLVRFDGQPVAAERGELVYLFPDLLPTTRRPKNYGAYPTHAPVVRGLTQALRSLSGPVAKDYLQELVRPFTRQDTRLVRTMALANCGACLVLGALLGPLQLLMRSREHAAALAVLNAIYGGLLCNGIAWVVLPLIRRIRLFRANWGVRRRNGRRRRLAARLAGAIKPPELSRKLAAARALAFRGHHAIRTDDVCYTTAKSLLEQAGTHNPLLDRFDQTLEDRQRGLIRSLTSSLTAGTACTPTPTSTTF